LTRRRAIGLGALVVLGVVAALVPGWLRRGGERLADEVAARMSEALGADCRVTAARVRSSREVSLEGVGCVYDEGPLVGFGIGWADVAFEGSPLRGGLPPVSSVEVADLDVRLREPPRLESEGDDDDSAAGRATTTLEREARRFLEFSEALDTGAGGDVVPDLRRRLTDGGRVSVTRAVLGDQGGEALLADVHAAVERRGEVLDVAVAAQLKGGGLVALDGALSDSGLQGARIRLEEVPVARILGRLGPDSLEARAGAASGDLRYASGEHGTWSLDVGLQDVDVRHEAVGKDWLPLPTVRLRGTVVPDREGGRIELQEGSWEVAGAGGDLLGRLGPLGPDAQVALLVEAERLPLGQLLGALPETLLPSAWAEEIQGTADLSVDFGGPLHRRSEWDLDWQADFSRLVLASGELASEVQRLRAPFPHTFDAGSDAPFTRLMGPEDPMWVSLREVSPHLISAVVSTEDSGFFAHSGFSEESLREAVLENLREGGGRGGSTITQQLAKNLFLSGDRTFARKLREAVIAWRLESDLPKERILEIYLNLAEWGPGIYGAKQATDHYFARSPRVLAPQEAAFMASLLPSPRRYHRYYHRGRGLTENRFSMVQDILRSMHRMGRLGAVDYHLARGEPIELVSCHLE